VATLTTFPNAHFIHPQVVVDVEGKREWDADEFGYRLISIYNEDTGSENKGEDQEPIQDTLKEIYQLLISGPWQSNMGHP
jgi:hypothetical protein